MLCRCGHFAKASTIRRLRSSARSCGEAPPEGTEPDVTSTIEKTVRPQCGDVRYLHAAMRAMEKQARLFPNGDIIPRVLAEPEPLTEAAKLGDEEIVDSKVEPDDQRTSDLPLKMLMALGAARDPQQAANISRHGPPRTQGSPRDPRRKRERRHNESGPPQLDIGPADRGGIDVSICGPSPGG